MTYESPSSCAFRLNGQPGHSGVGPGWLQLGVSNCPLVTPTAVSVHRRVIRLLLDGSGFDFERRCWPPGKLTRANDDSNPYDGRQQIPCRSRPGRGTAQMVVSKKCKSNHPSASNVTSQTGDQWAADAYRAWHPSAREAAMKRCAQCHGRLGLGVRSRNLWNGRWWAHARFCSAHCEGKYELERYNANAKQHRWYTFLYPSSAQS